MKIISKILLEMYIYVYLYIYILYVYFTKNIRYLRKYNFLGCRPYYCLGKSERASLLAEMWNQY